MIGRAPLTKVARIECDPGNGLPGLRTWMLTAYDEDGGEILTEATPTGPGANLKKYALFVQGLKEQGYVLQRPHHVELKQKLEIDWCTAWEAIIAVDANLMNKSQTAAQLLGV